MKVHFLGVGEACDPLQPNTSLLLEFKRPEGPCQILLDCGFTVPHRYFSRGPGPESLAGIWISHFHGDHFFGLPLLQLRLAEMNRKSPLLLLGQAGLAAKVGAALELAYPGFSRKLTYPVEFMELEPGPGIDALGLRWRTAENEHSQRSLAVRLDHHETSLFYSGDGRPTVDTLALASRCRVVVHEAYRLERLTPGHGSVRNCLDFARQARVSQLVLVHLAREDRRLETDLQEILAQASDLRVSLPDTGDEILL